MSAHLTLIVDRRRSSGRAPAGGRDRAVSGAPIAVDTSDRAARVETEESGRSAGTRDAAWVHAAWVPRPPLPSRPARPQGAPVRGGLAVLRGEDSERGAVTAEYAIVILAGVAFAGVLVAIMRSGEIRQMLVDLVQNALGSAG